MIFGINKMLSDSLWLSFSHLQTSLIILQTLFLLLNHIIIIIFIIIVIITYTICFTLLMRRLNIEAFFFIRLLELFSSIFPFLFRISHLEQYSILLIDHFTFLNTIHKLWLVASTKIRVLLRAARRVVLSKLSL